MTDRSTGAALAEVARRDQLEAAREDALVALVDVLRAWRITSRYPWPASRAIVEQYGMQVLVAGLDGCEHLSSAAPAAAWWVADSPSVVRCASCTSVYLRRSDPAPAGCDLCGEVTRLRPVAAAVRPALGRDAAGELVSCPPAVCLAGVCESCWSMPGRSAA